MERVSWEPSTDLKKTSRKCDPGWLSIKMKMLFGSYRLDQYPDPDAFLAIAGTVLENYDPQIVAIVTSPLTGMQRKCKFPPTIAELVEECDRVKQELLDAERRRNQPKPIPAKVEIPKVDPEKNYDAMFAKYGRPIGFFE